VARYGNDLKVNAATLQHIKKDHMIKKPSYLLEFQTK